MLSEEEITRGKALLDEYYDVMPCIEEMSAVDKSDCLERLAEKFVDYLTDIIHNE